MNEYQMSYLAETRRRDLRDEADRARLARQARAAGAGKAPDRASWQRRSLGLGLRTLLRRPT